MTSRREFIGALAALPLASRGTLSSPRIRFGYAAITWNGKDDQAVEDIEAVGFPGIQLRSGILPAYEQRPAALRALLAAHRLTFVALSSGNVSVEPAQRTKTIEEHVSHARFV